MQSRPQALVPGETAMYRIPPAALSGYHPMRPLTALLLALVLAPAAAADDWPQWMGPNRDAVWAETGILDRLPPEGPKVLWRTPVAGGYAGPAVAGGKVYLAAYVKSAGDATP